MESDRFDTLSRSLATIGTRRGVTRLLLGVPLLGGLAGVLGAAPDIMAIDDDHGSSGRRHRRRTRHDRRRNTVRRNKKHKPNKPNRPAQPKTCSPACPVCQKCDTRTGQCVPDAGQNRTTCAGGAGATSVCCNGECCAGCCGAGGVCGACLAFLTSTNHNGNLGGLDGAAAICQARAAAGNLPGTYQAWLSDSTDSPSTRFRCTQASCSRKGYQRVDAEPIASDWGTLTDGTLDNPISVTEFNTPRPPGAAWSHTSPAGAVGFPPDPTEWNCSNWTVSPGPPAAIGDTAATDATWTETESGITCAAQVPLYCFQQS